MEKLPAMQQTRNVKGERQGKNRPAQKVRQAPLLIDDKLHDLILDKICAGIAGLAKLSRRRVAES